MIPRSEVPQRRIFTGYRADYFVERRLLALILGLQNVGNFEFATKNEAIVNALRVRLCTPDSYCENKSQTSCIFILRGVICHCSFCCNGNSYDLEGGMSW